MPASMFEKGIVTCTFLVNLADMSLEELQRPLESREVDELWLTQDQDSDDEQSDDSKILDIKDAPQFWAKIAVNKLFKDIFVRTRPQGVLLSLTFVSKDSDAPHVAEAREKIENGEKPGQLVTVCLEFTRPDLTRPYLTRPEHLPFPGLTWLTSQIPLEPGSGFALLYMTAAQIPA